LSSIVPITVIVEVESMVTMTKKRIDFNNDITYYAKDGRLTEPSDGK